MRRKSAFELAQIRRDALSQPPAGERQPIHRHSNGHCGDSGTDPKTTSWNINSVFKTTTGRNTTFTGTYNQGSDYALYNSVTADGSGNISGYFQVGGGDGAFSGVQLIAVPEPQAWALASLGASAILFRLRHKSRAA